MFGVSRGRHCVFGVFPCHLENLQSQMALMGNTTVGLGAGLDGERCQPRGASILAPFLASCWSFPLIFSLSCSSRSPLLPVPALISSALTQSLVSLCLFPAKPSPFGPLPAGGSPGRGNVRTHEFSLPFSGWSLVHPFQPARFPAYQPWGWLGKHFKQAGVSPARALPCTFPLAAFQKRAPNPSGLAVPPHSAGGGISSVFPPQEFESGCYFLLDFISKLREEKEKKNCTGEGERKNSVRSG